MSSCLKALDHARDVVVVVATVVMVEVDLYVVVKEVAVEEVVAALGDLVEGALSLLIFLSS